MPRIARPLSILICLVLFSLCLIKAAVAQAEPSVSILTGSDAGSGSKLAYVTTTPEFCTSLLLQGTGAGLTGTIPLRVTAYALRAGDSSPGTAIVPQISAEGCDDPGAGSTLELGDFGINEVRQVWLAAQPSTIATYTGPLLLQAGGEAPSIYTVELTRRPRTLAVAPVTAAGTFTLTTPQEMFSRDLWLELKAGEAPITALEYAVDLGRADGDMAEHPSICLALGGACLDRQIPITLTGGAPIPVALMGELPQAAAYTGRLDLMYDGQVQSVPLAIERAVRPLEIVQPAAGSFTIDTKAAVFTRTLDVRLPHDAGSPQLLRYSYTLERDDGIEAAPAVLAVLYAGQDANAAPVELLPGERVPLTLVGQLPEAGAYTGQLLLHYGDGQSKTVPLTLQHTAYAPAEGLVFPTPEPSRWTAEPLLWGANTKTTFQIENTSDQPIPLQDVQLVALNRLEGGQVVASQLAQAQHALTGAAADSRVLDKHTVSDLVLTVDGLQAGEYEARVMATTPDGRKVESTSKFSVRHQWMPFFVIAASLVLAWAVQSWATGGRKRAMADLRISQLGTQIQRHLRDVAVLPAWIRPHEEPQHAWMALDQRLDRLWTNARLQRNAQETENVYADIEKRASSLDEALGLVKSIDSLFAINKTSDQDPERLAIESEVRQQMHRLYGLLEGTKEALEENTSGAPSVIGALKSQHQIVKRMRFDAQIVQLRTGLAQLEGDTALAAAVQNLNQELDNIDSKLDGTDFDAAAMQEQISRAEGTYYDLLWKHLAVDTQVENVARQLQRLEGVVGETAYKAAEEQITAVRAALPAAGASVRDKVELWQDVEPQLWLAQVKVWQAELAAHPGDLTPTEWQKLDGYERLLDKLKAAETVLETVPVAKSAVTGTAYQEAREAQMWLQRDLAAFRLQRLAREKPMGSDANQTAWRDLLGQALLQCGGLPRRGLDQLTLPRLEADRLAALDLLVQGLELANKALDEDPYKSVPQPDRGWREARGMWAGRVAEARRDVKAAMDTQRTQDTKPALLEDKVAGAEISYVAAAAGYQALMALWEQLKAPPAAPAEAPAALGLRPDAAAEMAGGTAMSKGLMSNLAIALGLATGPRPETIYTTMPLSPGYANDLKRDAQQREAEQAYRLSQYEKLEKSIKRQILYRNMLVYLVAFLITVLFAVVDKVFSNPTFGDWPDYVTLILFAFGATGISNATMGSVMSTLGLAAQQQG
jgi:hypothetical protein